MVQKLPINGLKRQNSAAEYSKAAGHPENRVLPAGWGLRAQHSAPRGAVMVRWPLSDRVPSTAHPQGFCLPWSTPNLPQLPAWHQEDGAGVLSTEDLTSSTLRDLLSRLLLEPQEGMVARTPRGSERLPSQLSAWPGIDLGDRHQSQAREILINHVPWVGRRGRTPQHPHFERSL